MSKLHSKKLTIILSAITTSLVIVLIVFSTLLVFKPVEKRNLEQTNVSQNFDEIDNELPLPTESTTPIPTTTSTIATTVNPTKIVQPTTTSPTPSEINWGNRNKNQVIFTFDAGSGSQSTRQIIDTLKKHNVTGTFFLTGTWANNNQDFTREISSLGYEIYNHTYTHPHLKTVSDDVIISEFKRTDDLIISLTGKSTKPFFRPPYGERNQHILDVAWSQGYRSIFWTIDALDWEESTGMTADQVKTKILTNVKPGTIYLMHMGDNITGQVLDDVFTQIEAMGYGIVPLSQGIQ